MKFFVGVLLFATLSFADQMDARRVEDKFNQHFLTKHCSYRWKTIGRTHQGKPIRMLVMPGKRKEGILITGSIHGNEKAGALVAFNLALNLCARANKMEYTALIVPVWNVDGYSGRPRGWRTNYKRKDLNRDAWRQTQPESRAMAGVLSKWRVVRYVDIHMTGPEIHLPRKFSRAYTASYGFAHRLRRNGFKKRMRQTPFWGVWITWFSDQGIPSALLEIGYWREARVYDGKKGLMIKRTHGAMKALYSLFDKPLPKIQFLRGAPLKTRLKRYEGRKWRRWYRTQKMVQVR